MGTINNQLNFSSESGIIRKRALSLLEKAKRKESTCEYVSVKVNYKTTLLVKKEKYEELGKERIIQDYQRKHKYSGFRICVDRNYKLYYF